MAAPKPTRKSGRQRVPNKKYVVDPFEDLDLDDPNSERESELLQEFDRRAVNDDKEGHDDFSEDDPAISEPIADEDDIMSPLEVSDGSAVVTPQDSDEEATIETLSLSLRGAKVGNKRQSVVYDNNVRSRNVIESHSKASHRSESLFLKQVIGESREELASFRRIRDRWAGNITLPTRHPNAYNQGGMDYPLGYSTEQRETEATAGWDWYYNEGGKAGFEAKQVIHPITADVGGSFFCRPANSSQSLLLGAYGKQQIFSLPFMQSLSLEEAWKAARVTRGASPNDHATKSPGRRQQGWILNVGTSVRCLEWAPNHSGNTQYLAISTSPPKDVGNKQPPRGAPAYTASLPTPSCIQIWALRKDVVSLNTIEMPPELQMVICTKWGYAKDLKWCPMPRKAKLGAHNESIHLGLLAGVWTDGYLRVLDLYLDRGPSSTRYIKCSSAAFEVRPPDTLCTCLTWISATDIAVGCANGYLAVWNIFPPTAGGGQQRLSSYGSPTPEATESSHLVIPGNLSVKPPLSPARPDLYVPIHQSYVLAIASAYPLYPHLFSTSSVSGHTRLTDVRSPSSDHVFAPHQRFAPSSIEYSAHINGFLTTHEDGKPLQAWPVRRFWAGVSLARGESELIGLATSHFHPTVLCGYADGTLLAFNPLRGYMGTRTRDAQPQQKVWKHEWARSRRAGQKQAGSDQGICRFTEGYKVEYVLLNPGNTSSRGVWRPAGNDEVAPMSTIYENESAVRVVTWNPNLEWGGWAASGTGRGLVRVEDLAI